ncbi:hypothetical protein BDZ94DRAFT_1275944 [Collybia nuda]|uniref:Secreted protein n=1 Tax=Collybia nuda TaxID=64659 RepID=A0A9P6C8K2_9AGAR|nr:hypothetical protein BDZ94DRAFT_1275944 [Collybia nuda]
MFLAAVRWAAVVVCLLGDRWTRRPRRRKNHEGLVEMPPRVPPGPHASEHARGHGAGLPSRHRHLRGGRPGGKRGP